VLVGFGRKEDGELRQHRAYVDGAAGLDADRFQRALIVLEDAFDVIAAIAPEGFPLVVLDFARRNPAEFAELLLDLRDADVKRFGAY
jgi:hypothetical protein